MLGGQAVKGLSGLRDDARASAQRGPSPLEVGGDEDQAGRLLIRGFDVKQVNEAS